MKKVVLLASLCTAAFAQSDTASLSGAVTDSGAASIVGAKITLRNKATRSERTALTDIQGLYHFSLLIPGVYEIAMDAPGMKRYQNEELTLNVAKAARLDGQLEVGANVEVINVRPPALLLNAETAAQGTVIGGEKIVSLPLNGRQFLQLALLVPGANAGGRAVQQNQFRQGMIGGLSISGGRTNNTNFLLDGAVNIDPDYSTINYQPTLDTIQEFQVQTAMFGAEYGHAGGQVNVATKSGTNEGHGSAWDFIRNNKLDARPFNLPSSSVPKFQRNQYAATLGGPIARNKLFAFPSYESLPVR